ncbi:hypothetical protein LCGC14_1736070 [marine sediment metagenome]|uniref:Recombination endonuclease VII n=1 Tax=marine sediment metagenome TaxID=412755 RepID=A0A0F9H7Z7_9ZZZZ
MKLDRAAKNKVASANLQRKYGITLADYDRMLKKQHGGCAICGRAPKTRRLDIDHDHKTGKVRGALCHRCNRGLAWYSDSPALLRSAAKYLSK